MTEFCIFVTGVVVGAGALIALLAVAGDVYIEFNTGHDDDLPGPDGIHA